MKDHVSPRVKESSKDVFSELHASPEEDRSYFQFYAYMQLLLLET